MNIPNRTQFWETARAVCTNKELAALELAAIGTSERTIAIELGISRSAVRARLENASRKIAKEAAA